MILFVYNDARNGECRLVKPNRCSIEMVHFWIREDKGYFIWKEHWKWKEIA